MTACSAHVRSGDENVSATLCWGCVFSTRLLEIDCDNIPLQYRETQSIVSQLRDCGNDFV